VSKREVKMKVYLVIWRVAVEDLKHIHELVETEEVDNSAFLTKADAETYASIELTKAYYGEAEDGSVNYYIKEVEVC